MSSSTKYLSEDTLVNDEITVYAKYPHRVKPVPASTILPYLDKQHATVTSAWDVHKVRVGKETRDAITAGCWGGAQTLLSLKNLSNVSHLTITSNSDGVPRDAVLFDLDIQGSELSLESMFPEPIFVDLELVFTYRDNTSKEKPLLEHIQYWPREEHEWICGVPTYSSVSSPNWKYVVAASVWSGNYMRDAHFCSELGCDYTVDPTPMKGTLVEDEKVYHVNAYTMNITALRAEKFGAQVTVTHDGMIGMSSTPCLFYDVDKDYIETFAKRVCELCPKSNTHVIYTKKFNAPPGLQAELESKSYDTAKSLHDRILALQA
jgi:hypothetical protein